MKLTLAMGLQYDNGKETSMVALSLGQGKPSTEMEQDEGVKEGLLHTVVLQSPSVQVSTVQSDQTVSGQNSFIGSEKMKAPFFLTYNLQGLSDTLVFDRSLVDMFV